MREKARPANIIPAIFVSGSNYEMGYQYGYQMADGIKWVRDQLTGGIRSMVNDNFEVWNQCLKGFQYYIKEYTPEIIDEMIGIAAGATDAGYDISYVDILTINVSVCVKSAFSPGSTLPSPLDELPPREYQEKYGLDVAESKSETQADPNLIEGIKDPEDLGKGCSRWAAWGTATCSSARRYRASGGCSCLRPANPIRPRGLPVKLRSG